MSDLIDRLAFRKAMYHEAMEKDSDEQKWDSGCWIRYKMFERVLDSMPQANQWIPCAVRLPLYNMRVLVVDKYNEIDIAELVDYSDVDEPDEWWTYEYKVHDIIAWMPLPEPWKGEEE